jgi:hypothetical protein
MNSAKLGLTAVPNLVFRPGPLERTLAGYAVREAGGKTLNIVYKFK